MVVDRMKPSAGQCEIVLQLSDPSVSHTEYLEAFHPGDTMCFGLFGRV